MIPPFVLSLSYLVAASCFILGLKWLSNPATARLGNRVSAFGMLIAVVVTLFDRAVISYEIIIAGILVGGVIGVAMARMVKMTSMPEMVALLNGFGGAASMLVGGAEFLRSELMREQLPLNTDISIQLSVLIGAVTFSGSLIAFAKLQELMSGRPFLFPMQKPLNMVILAVIAALAAYQIATAEPHLWPFYAVVVLSLLLGVLMVIPIGGADMPVVIALLNSLSGLAAAMTGFVINNPVLIISGALVGSSGLILTRIMSKAMNRSIANVLFSGFGSAVVTGDGKRSAEGLTVRRTTADDLAIQLAYARLVIIVPGYGMAVAQAQHQVRELAELIEKKGGEVKYAIHPVAGRMPGHMNVLLAEANVPYDRLITDVDEANAAIPRADTVIVLGANDIVNPAAIDEPSSPIFGMPIIRADQAPHTVVMKRSMASGFAGIENDLFYRANTSMLFGDAKATLGDLVREVKQV
ncbi:MAG TPA: NAD(P)(+) transhydrogenase (Re/Si-specific) subunit beta [Longimicrobiaceae bacterium]|nr:NAD(P)(+) transhydrogenase (Re/Si-specific) subunit beta [Longimicrobiaceae bacterium]